MGNFRDEASLPTECLEIFCLLSSLKINMNVLLLEIINIFDSKHKRKLLFTELRLVCKYRFNIVNGKQEECLRFCVTALFILAVNTAGD